MKTTVLYHNPFGFLNTWSDACMYEPLIQFNNFSNTTYNHNSDKHLWKINLPEFSKKDLSISLDNNSLIIKGYKKTSSLLRKNNENIYQFTKHIAVSDDMNTEKIKANFKKGVLTLEIPKKKESVSYREIPVNGDKNSDIINLASGNKKDWFTVLTKKLKKTFARGA
nr:Hsp20/alpha crystallin family protein [uncultured Carboxylicivirga sp.]